MRADPDRSRVVNADATLTAFAASVSALSLFGLSRPYLGIAQDAILYIGRAVADGDPSGLGRDILFAHDGQSRFSLFTLIAGRLVAWLGPGEAAWWLAHAGFALWLAGAVAFVSRFARGRLLWAAIVSLVLARALYSGDGGFRFAEPYAIPRPFAEAGVLFALACWLDGRRLACVACLAVAALLHPIMALAGIAVVALLLARQDRRWAVLFGGGFVLLVGLAFFGAPLAGRLLVSVDPDWNRTIGITNVVYPARWPAETWAAAAFQVVTVLIAARELGGDVRRVLVAAVLVALAGVAAAIVLGQWAGSLLVLQMQPWRPLWLLAVLSGMSLPIVAGSLLRGGRTDRVALAALAVAWLSDDPLPAVAGSLGGAVLAFGATRYVASRLVMRAAPLVVVAAALLWLVRQGRLLAEIVETVPPDATDLLWSWSGFVWKPIIAAAVIAWSAAARPRIPPALAACAAGALLLAASFGSDARPSLMRIIERWRPEPTLAAALGERPGEVLWLRANLLLPWALAGRPNWVSPTQGSSVLFSRELAVLWSARTDRVLAAGLGDASDRSPNVSLAERGRIAPSLDAVARFCAAPDAPATLLAPLGGWFTPPPGLIYSTYTMPAPSFDPMPGPDGRLVWSESILIAVIPCRAG